MKSTQRPNAAPKALHRIRDVRLAEEVSLETASRRMNQRQSVLKKEESPETDLRLSDLYRWQSALNVPLMDLLAEPDYALSETVRRRAALTRIAKTANSILRRSNSAAMKRLAQTLVDQLVEVMPELEHIGAWPERGTRKPANELGRIAELLVDDRWWASEPDYQL